MDRRRTVDGQTVSIYGNEGLASGCRPEFCTGMHGQKQTFGYRRAGNIYTEGFVRIV